MVSLLDWPGPQAGPEGNSKSQPDHQYATVPISEPFPLRSLILMQGDRWEGSLPQVSSAE